MPYTLMSDAGPVLVLDKVNLTFKTDYYRSGSFRDSFTRLVKDPLSVLSTPRDRLHVTRNVSLSAKIGERIGIMGLNGSGKTTLCRCIAGMYLPTTGSVERRGIMRAIFDTSIGIHAELTGRENARLLAEFMYPEVEDKHSLVEDALTFSGLGRFVDVPYRNYSNGMQARLCLSIISACPCDLLILDEVFDGADSHFREKVTARILNVIRGSGVVLFVSHSPEQVRLVCNRVLVLDKGEKAFDGPVEEGIAFYERLATTQE